MAFSYKVLGQVEPTTTNNTDLYTVPASTSSIISTLLITNTSAADATCRIFVRVAGASATKSNAIIYDGPVTANNFIAMSIGITLSATDIITVQSSIANTLTFQAFGSEII